MFIVKLSDGSYVDIYDDKRGEYTTKNKAHAQKFNNYLSAKAYMDFFWKEETEFEVEKISIG